MGDKDGSGESGSAVKELLLKDYTYISNLFLANESSGETRLNLFIGIFTAVVGALGFLITFAKADEFTLRLILIVSLIAVLLLGIITMLKILIRNENTDIYKRGLDTIRQFFLDSFDEDNRMVSYHPLIIPRKVTGGSQREKKVCHLNKKQVAIRRFGGLSHTLAAINSLLFAGFVGAVIYPIPVQNATIWNLLLVILAFGLSLVLQTHYITHRDIESKKKLCEGTYTHAGGVVYELKDGNPQYLLVRPKCVCADEWVLPKGHIEEGEWHGETALREVREESGVVARLICPIDSFRFITNGEEAFVKFYLMECISRCEPDKNAERIRQQRWLIHSEAINEVTHSESKCILKKAEELRQRRSSLSD